MLGATFVKRPANSLDVAGSVGCSSPIDPDRFLAVRFVVAFSQQRRTHALGPACPLGGYCFLRYVVPRSGHCIRMHNALSSDIYCIFAFRIVINTRALAPRVKEVHWFWASIFLSTRWTIGIRIRVSLFRAEFLLFRNPYCLF